jgi:hypothetical protein
MALLVLRWVQYRPPCIAILLRGSHIGQYVLRCIVVNTGSRCVQTRCLSQLQPAKAHT